MFLLNIILLDIICFARRRNVKALVRIAQIFSVNGVEILNKFTLILITPFFQYSNKKYIISKWCKTKQYLNQIANIF